MQSGLDTLTQLLDELAKTESQRSLLDDAKRQMFSNPTDNLSDKQIDAERSFTESYQKYKEDYVKCLSFNLDDKNLSKNFFYKKIISL